jgi:uncharacterized protein DUF2513
MKLDMDLVRELLFALERKPGPWSLRRTEITIEGHDQTEIGYHLNRMYEAGFICGEVLRSTSTAERIIEVIPFDLTWQGHQFLETVRDPELWRKTKAGARGIGSVGVDVLKDIAKGIIKKKIKQLSDVDLG